MKRILSFFLTVALSAALLVPGAAAVNEAVAKDTDWLYITIDPGHGGDGAGGYDPGAINSTYGYQEADRVLRIGLYLKQELETYRHVHVDMTRSDRDGTYYTAPLSKVQRRVDFAQQKGSDLLVSLHLNGAATQSAHGALILASNGNYDPACANIVDGVGTNILTQLGKLGPSLRLRQNLQPTQLLYHAGFHLIGFHSVPPSSCFGYSFRKSYRKLL